MKYLIQYGVGGGFNDTENYEIAEFETQETADGFARMRAVEIFDSYDYANYGIDDNASQEEVDEEMESWLDYSAEPYDEEKHKEIVEEHKLL